MKWFVSVALLISLVVPASADHERSGGFNPLAMLKGVGVKVAGVELRYDPTTKPREPLSPADEQFKKRMRFLKAEEDALKAERKLRRARERAKEAYREANPPR